MVQVKVIVVVETTDDELHGFTEEQIKQIAEDAIAAQTDNIAGEGFRVVSVDAD